MKNIFKKQENKIILGVLLLTLLVAGAPLISRYCINGHDLDYHLLRIEALKDNILIGRPFLKVNPLFFGGAGYASSMFYSDFLLYVPAVLRTLGVSIGASYHIFVELCIILCLLSMYYCASKMTKSKYAGAVAAIMLTLCPYHMDDLMVRAAVGEYLAFIFVPFVLYGIYNLLYEEMNKPWILAVGFGGVIFSHTATTVMCLIFAVVACIIKIKTLLKNPKIFVKIVLTAGVTALITSIYWLPMLEQFLSGKFSVSTGEGIDMLDAAVDFSKVMSQQFPTIGVALILPVVLRFFVNKKEDSMLEYADWMIIGGGAFCVLSTNIVPWEYLSRIFSFVQFPWRFFLIASVLFALADTIILKSFIENVVLKALQTNEENRGIHSIMVWGIAVSVVFVAFASLALTHQTENDQGYYDYSNDYYSYKPYTCSVIGGEWLPESVKDRSIILDDSETLVANNGKNLDFLRDKGKITSTVNDSSYEYLDVPFIYYKGYSAYIKDSNGNKEKLLIDGSAKNGFCRVYTNGKTGELSVYYTGTAVLFLSYITTLIGLVLCVFYFVKIKGKAEK